MTDQYGILMQIRNKDTLIINRMSTPSEIPSKVWIWLFSSIILSGSLIYLVILFQNLYNTYRVGFIIIFSLVAFFDGVFILLLIQYYLTEQLKRKQSKKSKNVKVQNWRSIEISHAGLCFIGNGNKVIKLIPIDEIDFLKFDLKTHEYTTIEIEKSFFLDLLDRILTPRTLLDSFNQRSYTSTSSQSGLKFLFLHIHLKNGDIYNSRAIWSHYEVNFLLARAKKIREMIVNLQILPFSKIRV